MSRIVFPILLTVLCSTLLVLALSRGSAAWGSVAPLPAQMAFSLAQNTTITVTTNADELSVNGTCSLREAIQAANTDAGVDSCPAGQGVDTILLSSGVYRLTLTGRGEDDNATGDLDIHSSLVISGAGAGRTTIDAAQIDRVLHVFTETVVTIWGFTIQNGKSAAGSATGCGNNGDNGCDGEPGGGIYNSGRLTIIDIDIVGNRSGDGGSSLSGNWPFANGGDGGGIFNRGVINLYNSNITGNETGWGGDYSGSGGNGGGIANADGELLLERSVISGNYTGRGGLPNNPYSGRSGSGNGGGIHNTGIFTVTDSTIAHNRTTSGGDGGGLFNRGQGMLLESTVHDNSADANGSGGGGGIINQGTLFLARSVIDGNQTDDGSANARFGLPAGSGGGILNTAILTVENSTISNNRAGDGGNGQYGGGDGGNGGGIHNTGTLRLENATFTRNVFGVGGRAIYAPPPERRPSPSHNPSVANYASDGHGGAIANEGVVRLHNTILSSNNMVGDGPDCWGVFVSTGYNLIQNRKDCTLDGDSTGNILDHSAWLEPLADNGGPTVTHALRPQSPALNAGSCINSDGASVTIDQRGEPRPQGVGCDMGAFESGLAYIPPLTVYLPLLGNLKE